MAKVVAQLLVAGLVMAFGVGCAAPSSDDGPSAPSTTVPAAVTTVSQTPPPPTVPPVSAAAAAVGFIDVKTVVPDAIVDMRYASANNFVGVPLYPPDARCLVHGSMADGLAAAAATLRPSGEVLVFWDCYRPHDVQVRMFDTVPNPNWVAKPGDYSRSHEAGRSVDVTISGQQGLLDMGTDFDDFTSRGKAFATDGVGARAQENRVRLRSAMAAGGLNPYDGEWWHFDGPDAKVHRPIINVPVN